MLTIMDGPLDHLKQSNFFIQFILIPVVNMMNHYFPFTINNNYVYEE